MKTAFGITLFKNDKGVIVWDNLLESQRAGRKLNEEHGKIRITNPLELLSVVCCCMILDKESPAYWWLRGTMHMKDIFFPLVTVGILLIAK